MASEIPVSICFDNQSRVNILSADKVAHTEELNQECLRFTNKMEEFNTVVSSILQVMEDQAQRVEQTKLRAIGQRNKVDSEVENRLHLKATLQAEINEKMIELERYSREYQSLVRIEAEQSLLIERLCNNEP